MTHTKHLVGPLPNQPCHLPQILTLIKHITTRKQTHNLTSLNTKFIRLPLTLTSQWLFSWGIKQNLLMVHNTYTNKPHMPVQHHLNHQLCKKISISFMTFPFFELNTLIVQWMVGSNLLSCSPNSDPYKLVLAKSQGSFSKTISSYTPTVGWNKMKECLHYNFGSVVPKWHAASMLIDQQQKPSETL